MDLTVDVVGKTDKELSTSECIDLVIDPLLGKSVVNDTLSLSGFVKSLSELEEVGRSVEVAPHHLSVVRVVTTGETLLATVIEEGDTSGSEGKSQSTLELSLIRVGMKEARVVMVVNENTKSINVLEVLVVGLPSAGNVSH